MKNGTLRSLNIILLVGAMACLVCYDICGGLWLKGVTSAWFFTLGAVNLFAARKRKGKERAFFILMTVGLFCGMCADVLLGVMFFAGVGVFALGHVMYLAAFYALEGFRILDLWIMAPVALISVFIVIGTPWLTVQDPFMQKLLLGYALVISAMLGKALSNAVGSAGLFRKLVAIACVLFWFSDLMLAMDMFGKASRLTWILCSYSYWPAQNLLAHSLYHAGKELRRS